MKLQILSFLLGFVGMAIICLSVFYLGFTLNYRNQIYPGVKTVGEISQNNLDLLTFTFNSSTATISATGKELSLVPNTQLMEKRAFSIGRQTPNPYYNLLQIIAAYQGKINLPFEVKIDEKILEKKVNEIASSVEYPAIDAIYEFIPGAGPDGKGRVKTFKPSKNGLEINREKIKQAVIESAKNNKSLSFAIPVDIVTPQIQTSTADSLGIQNLLGKGESYFYDSIPNRVYNIGLGSEKINGSLIKPGEIFSFDTAIGTVSAIFGFKKAYSIKEGKTVLDDGGGVCQVATTLYRAVLNAGLPILERVAHTYRVGFYEQGGYLPGLDATVYPPSPDLRFKNDTNGYLLIQVDYDTVNMKLTFDIFGKDDGRKTEIKGPYILSTSPPPDPIYEDDPISPIGQISQIDTAHSGAEVYFQRIVTRGNEILINEAVKSSYIPWPARFLKGTKNN